MAQYRKRPEIVDAIQFTGDNQDEVWVFIGYSLSPATIPGEWIIKSDGGRLSVMSDVSFRETYEVPTTTTEGPAPSTL